MVEFTLDVSPAIVVCVNVGFAVVVNESVNIRVRSNLQILVYPVFMPNRKIDMEVFGEGVPLDEIHRHIKLFCVEVEGEIRVLNCEGRPHFKFLHGFNLTALVDTHHMEAFSVGELVIEVSEHLIRASAKPYGITSVTQQRGLWKAVVGLVYIAVL